MLTHTTFTPLPMTNASFLFQTLINDNPADTFQKLTWFSGQLTPFPVTLPPGSLPLLPPHDPTAPGTSA
jgi:hypothetical protein